MFAGLRHASGDAVVVVDAGLRNPPELVGGMVELPEKGMGRVIAGRFRDSDRLSRGPAARARHRLIDRLVDGEPLDGAGEFRLLSRRAVAAVPRLTEADRFSKGLSARVGLPSAAFGYTNAARAGGSSKWSPAKLLNYGLDGLLSFNSRPLRAALWLGMTLLTLAGGYALWIVGSALRGGVQTPGYVTTIVVVTALSGAQMTMIAVIGEYLGRTYREVKRRPHFLVKATNAGERRR